jgi:YidC/Oxa1 family membrane protein insertase
VAQLPVFLSLYYMLRTDLRHDICPAINPPGTPNPQACGETAASHFLFIPDLTSRATGTVLVALLALYIGSQLFSFLLSANPTMDKTQRTIFIALPFFFITIAWQLPAGPARVLDHHEHVDDRPGRDRAQAPGPSAPGGARRAGGRRRTWRAG